MIASNSWQSRACIHQVIIDSPEQGFKLLGLPLTGQLVSTWQVDKGWPDIHWLGRDLGWAGSSHCASLGQELEYAVGA